MRILRTFALVVSVTLFACSAFAQNVSGRVTDPQGGAVRDAAVLLSGPGNATPASVRTGDDGAFAFPSVAEGLYVLSVEAPGFQRWTQAITVNEGDGCVGSAADLCGELGQPVERRFRQGIENVVRTKRDQPFRIIQLSRV